MASSSKFPSGLNNWAGTDKPVRTDFNSDNEIIDGNAMWKAVYDPKEEETDLAGPVEQAGGIPAYALARAEYDADGNVAALGGIEAAIAAKGDAISVYLHTKEGSVHHLTLDGGGDNIKFVAAYDFAPDDVLMINGVETAVLNCDGRPLAEPFLYADVVLMLRSGDSVRVLAPLHNSLTKEQVGLGSVDNVQQMPLAGGTFTGVVKVPAGTDYATGRVRNIFFNTTATWPSEAQDGDILFVYT